MLEVNKGMHNLIYKTNKYKIAYQNKGARRVVLIDGKLFKIHWLKQINEEKRDVHTHTKKTLVSVRIG